MNEQQLALFEDDDPPLIIPHGTLYHRRIRIMADYLRAAVQRQREREKQ